MTGPRVCWGGKGELASYLLTGTPAGWKGQWSKAVLSHKPMPRVCLDIDAAETVLRTSRERVCGEPVCSAKTAGEMPLPELVL